MVRSTSKTIGTPQLQNNPQVNSQVPKRGTKQVDTIGTARARSVSLIRNRSLGRPRSVSTKGRKAQCNTPNFTPVDNTLNLTGNGNIQHTQSQLDDEHVQDSVTINSYNHKTCDNQVQFALINVQGLINV